MEEKKKRLAVVRVRGRVDRSQSLEKTMHLLHLNKINHCVILDDRPTYKGMFQKVKDIITWGELTPEALKVLLLKRGRTKGNKKITDNYIKENTEYNGIDDFIEQFLLFQAEIDQLKIKPVFRLHPPRKGHGKFGIKRPFSTGGSTGYRGTSINDLITRMS